MSRLVDYPALPEALRDLGFGAVTFSYPLRTLPSSYLACAESPLVDFTPEELHASFEAVKALGKQFPVLNPVASIEDMQRHLRGDPERFGCLAGWKFFYLDWHLQIWRCHNWDRPLCDIREFDGTQRVRDGCTACMIDCYRDDSLMQHVGVAVSCCGSESCPRGYQVPAIDPMVPGLPDISLRRCAHAVDLVARAVADSLGPAGAQPVTPASPRRRRV
jgi:hypothetical protein